MTELRTATVSDAEAIASLIAEIDRFYGAMDAEPAAVRVPAIHAALFATPPTAHAILAWDGDRLVGMASYSFLWPAAGVTRSLFLKELYVSEDSRGGGIGHALMRGLCNIASENECSRVEWTTDADNPMAQRFYAKLGVAPDSSKLFYRLDGDTLRRFAGEQTRVL